MSQRQVLKGDLVLKGLRFDRCMGELSSFIFMGTKFVISVGPNSYQEVRGPQNELIGRTFIVLANSEGGDTFGAVVFEQFKHDKKLGEENPHFLYSVIDN